MKKTLSPLVFFLVSTLSFFSCSSPSQSELFLFSGHEMTIDYRILIGHPLNSKEQEIITQVITTTFDEVNHIYNKWNSQSELSKLNKLKAYEKVKISQELYLLLLRTDQIVKLTDSRFDPTIEAVQNLWKDYLEKGQEPTENSLLNLATTVGWNKIHFEDRLFFKENDLISIDLGGIAKGYCVDLLVERLNQAGYQNIFVEWGGEIRTSGQHPEKRAWNIFISHLGNPDPEKALNLLSLKNQAIATSGDYLQTWKIKTSEKELLYFHIIDPVTLHPLQVSQESIASASVVCSSCTLADGLATALMLFQSKDEANTWMEKIKEDFPEINYWIYSRKDLKP